eukprot:30274-Pelagococcus_subviridis.AAC.4
MAARTTLTKKNHAQIVRDTSSHASPRRRPRSRKLRSFDRASVELRPARARTVSLTPRRRASRAPRADSTSRRNDRISLIFHHFRPRRARR